MATDQVRDSSRSGLSVGLVSAVAIIVAVLVNYRAILQGFSPTIDFGSGLDRSIYDPSDSSLLLGLVVFLFLTYARRDLIRSAFGGPGALGLGSVCLTASSGLLVWAHQTTTLDLLMPSFVLFVFAVALILGGRRLSRAIAMPLLALIVVIPIPAIMINSIVFPMQMTTAGLTSWLLSLVGRSHVLSGDLITTRGIAFQVIEGCSGLKSTMSLVLASVVFTDIVSRNALEKVVIVSLAPLIGVFVNGLRVLILVLSAAPAESTEHTVYGLLMMVLGVILLAGIESLLARTVFARGRRAMPIRARVIEAPAKSDRANRRLGFLAVAAWVSVLFVSVMPVGQWEIAKGPRINIETLPTEIGGWTSRGIPFDNALLGSVWFRHRIYRTYERDSDKIRVFVGLEEAPEFGRSGYSAKTKIPFSGWRSIQNLAVSNSSGVAADRLVIRYPSRSVMVHHLRLGYAPWGLEAIGSWLGIDRTNLGGWPVALVIRVEAEIDADDSSDVDLRLRHFLQKIADWYQSPR